MSDKGIIFSAPMVRALLDGRKTQTRRLLKPQPNGVHSAVRHDDGWLLTPVSNRCEVDWAPPRFWPGDRLYVREAFAPLDRLTHDDPGVTALAQGCFYRATGDAEDHEITRWTPSIHMPRWASRLTLLVTDVRVQRVAEISEEDAGAEGVYETEFYDNAERKVSAGAPWSVERLAFADLWNSLHDKPGERWEDNPWIVAVTFDVRRGNIDRISE